LLLPDPTSRGCRQTCRDITTAEADVFQFPIAKLTKDGKVRLAYSARDYAGDPAVHETAGADQHKTELAPDCRNCRCVAWGNIKHRHCDFLSKAGDLCTLLS
jgi:hypothetical protein